MPACMPKAHTSRPRRDENIAKPLGAVKITNSN